MNFELLTKKEKLDLANSTNEIDLLKLLILQPEMLVRRAILRNKNITTEIVNMLAYDVTENVSYMALKHKKCTEIRTIDVSASKCISCSVDERRLNCENCPNV